MRQEFFTTTSQSNFIKNLLLNTALPLYNSVRDNDFLIKGNTYVYKNSLIRCTKTGYFNLDENNSNLAASTTENAIKAEIEVINNNFYFGRWYLKDTQIFESNQLAYDSDTHKYLGEYLRFYKDIFNTDLLPFYNCFNGVYTTKYFVESEIDNGQFKYIVKQSNYDFYQQGNSNLSNKYHTKETFKVLQIPIKFNKKYTIAIDCDSQVLIAPAFINNGRLLELNFGGYKLNLTNAYNKIFEYNHLMFNKPICIDIDNTDETLVVNNYSEISYVSDINPTMCELFQKYERDLYLLIQIPTENNSSVVVLEGNYTNLDENKHFNIECLCDDSMEYPSKDFLDRILLSNLSLIQLDDNTRYPFADRLVEYLLWNVIDENEEIGENVNKVQDKLNVNTDNNVNHVKGVFDDYLRALAFNSFKNSNKFTNIDINGNIDKDIEKYLFG